ncbi:hypothetical protein RUM44_012861 [Polyplax serrata]|uniref:Distal membrane arm assembly complex 2-like protein n=1 Tax=Polyplax serrata TaxID=468196 RepID=A0ABR1BCT8_POLSC
MNRCSILDLSKTYCGLPKQESSNVLSKQEGTELQSKEENDDDKELKYLQEIAHQGLSPATNTKWNEKLAIRRVVKSHKFLRNVNSMTSLLREIQSLNSLPKTFSEIPYYLKKKKITRQVLEQSFLPERQAVLKADLAAAYFIIGRGGSVKFLGQESWVGKGCSDKLPVSYVPGYTVESIDAEGTGLVNEGLANIADLQHLKWLSLKGSNDVDDWFLDTLTSNHKKLEYLSIANCKNVTYRALSCFYRFKCLKTLDVEGVPDTPEFKVACLMLLDIMPDLEILGIDLKVPVKIEGIQDENEVAKQLSESQSLTKCQQEKVTA